MYLAINERRWRGSRGVPALKEAESENSMVDVAQSGERLFVAQEVAGSMPAIHPSLILRPPVVGGGRSSNVSRVPSAAGWRFPQSASPGDR